MAVASKAASFAAFVRVFLGALGGLKEDWQLLLVAISVATMILGNVVAIVQTNIKRMLAYSSIAHAGYALIGLAVADAFGTASVMLYLAIYAFMTLGAFTVVTMLRRGGLEGDEIDDFTGLAKRNKWAALVMLLFMISLTGIPPTGGFIAKFYIFMAAVSAGMTGLAVLAVIFAAVSAYYYLRVVMVMYMRDPGETAGAPGYGVRVVTSAATVAMYSTARTAARPPQQVRAPRRVPLSRFSGATPTKAAICLRSSVPNSGRSASRVRLNTGPTPGTLCSRSSWARHRGLCWRCWPNSLSNCSRRASNQAMCVAMSAWIAGEACPRRFFSAVSISTN